MTTEELAALEMKAAQRLAGEAARVEEAKKRYEAEKSVSWPATALKELGTGISETTGNPWSRWRAIDAEGRVYDGLVSKRSEAIVAGDSVTVICFKREGRTEIRISKP